MMPIAPLMIEHRLMDRMIALMEGEVVRMRRGSMNIGFIGDAVDFFVAYVDLCHHGKEEDILFRSLGNKEISPELRTIMKELLEEHEIGRRIVGGLSDARERVAAGEMAARDEMTVRIEEMLALYPSHIEKEDKRFFVPSMKYFSSEEQERMLAEMNKFDRSVTHDQYKELVNRLEQQDRSSR